MIICQPYMVIRCAYILELLISSTLIFQEARNPLQVWITQKNNGLLIEEGQNDGEFFFALVADNNLFFYILVYIRLAVEVTFACLYLSAYQLRSTLLLIDIRNCAYINHPNGFILERDRWRLRLGTLLLYLFLNFVFCDFWCLWSCHYSNK